jgi:hypothetical protein
VSTPAAVPASQRADRNAAHAIPVHPEQGWSLLCNGVVRFDDTGELLPNGRINTPHRPDRRSFCPEVRNGPTASSV